jgi:hypothetical protein
LVCRALASSDPTNREFFRNWATPWNRRSTWAFEKGGMPSVKKAESAALLTTG